MPWFRVDDGFDNHPKILAAGNAAAGMFARLGAYCARYSTEGRIPDSIVRTYGTTRERDRLVAVGLLKHVDDGWQLHDYLDYNPTAEQVKASRQANAERQRRFRESRRDTPPARNGVTNARSNGATNAAPSQPNPIDYISRPLTGGVVGRRMEDD